MRKLASGGGITIDDQSRIDAYKNRRPRIKEGLSISKQVERWKRSQQRANNLVDCEVLRATFTVQHCEKQQSEIKFTASQSVEDTSYWGERLRTCERCEHHQKAIKASVKTKKVVRPPGPWPQARR